mgnify:CR=1 FL=1
MGIFGWSYPAGAENDPNAPYNQVDYECSYCGLDTDECTCEFCRHCGNLEDSCSCEDKNYL